MTDREDDEREREDDRRDELDEDEVRPDEQLLLALALRPGARRFALGRCLRLLLPCCAPRAGHYSGRARPPSRRMRQKCTAMKIAASSGNPMTCSV